MTSTAAEIQAVRNALSAARISTYHVAAGAANDGDPAVLKLYAWNAQVSAALLAPLHICEVVIRNAVSDAIEAQYGNRWPWSASFERSLPDPCHGYSPRRDLQSARRRGHTPGKVIPELKFVFWQKMFTHRFDHRLWHPFLLQVLPNLDKSQSPSSLRGMIYNSLEKVRELRNRIAHHEPIFKRNLTDDFDLIVRLVESRCGITSGWMINNQQAKALIDTRP